MGVKMSEKNCAWKEITSPEGGDASEFFLDEKHFRVVVTLKDKNGFGERVRLCRVSDGETYDRKFAVLSSFIRVDSGTATKTHAVLRGIIADEAEAMAAFCSTYDG